MQARLREAGSPKIVGYSVTDEIRQWCRASRVQRRFNRHCVSFYDNKRVQEYWRYGGIDDKGRQIVKMYSPVLFRDYLVRNYEFVELSN